MGRNLKPPFSPFTYPITYKVGFWYFRSLCIRDMFSNKTYQNFCDKRLVRPGGRYPIWHRSQTISYKTKFLQRDNIYLVHLKYNITYQNMGGETKVRPICMPWKALNGKKVTKQITWMSFLQNRSACFKEERLPITYYNFHHKSLVRTKKIDKDLNP